MGRGPSLSMRIVHGSLGPGATSHRRAGVSGGGGGGGSLGSALVPAAPGAFHGAGATFAAGVAAGVAVTAGVAGTAGGGAAGFPGPAGVAETGRGAASGGAGGGVCALAVDGIASSASVIAAPRPEAGFNTAGIWRGEGAPVNEDRGAASGVLLLAPAGASPRVENAASGA